MKTARFAVPALLALLPLVTAACSGGADAASLEADGVEIVADETETLPADSGSCCATETAENAPAADGGGCCAGEAGDATVVTDEDGAAFLEGGDACCAGEEAAEETPGCCK